MCRGGTVINWSDFLFTLELLMQAVVTGLLIGGIFALMSVGLGLIFGLMRVINFAQPDFMMLGMYAAFFFVAWLGGVGVLGVYASPLVAAVVSALAVGLFGWLVHYFLVGKVTGARGGHDAQIMMTLGVALLLQNGALIVFGADPHTIKSPLSAQAWVFGFIFVNKAKAVACLVAVILTLGLHAFMTRTMTGKALRAAADNPEAATYMGIDVDRAHRLGFALGVGLTGAAGALIATYHPFHPYIGLDFLILMYASVVLGGLGSISGAFWGGMTIGMIQQVSTVFIPIQLQNMVVFLAFLLIVLVRPNGLFGRVSERV